MTALTKAPSELAPAAGAPASAALIGQPIPRLEDAAILTGQARYTDDLPVKPGTLHAAILRSPHAHAEILGIDVQAARAMKGVAAVVTGEDAKRFAAPFLVGVRAPMEHWCLAVDRVRYAGEPVAVVLADDRYLAEDALDRIEVRYRPLPAVMSIDQALSGDGEPLHPAVGSNIVNTRPFSYGDVNAAFEAAEHRISAHRPLSPQLLHPDGVLRGHGRLRSGGRDLRGPVQLLRAFRHPSRHGEGAQGAGLEAPAQAAAQLGRKLREQAGGIPLHRASWASAPGSPAAPSNGSRTGWST